MKLLRKDVLKWIRVLGNGSYRKGKNKLVSNYGTKFCCLGVWADMQGAVWDESSDGNLCPMLGTKKHLEQYDTYLIDPKLSRGLDLQEQGVLARINDDSVRGFKPVIAYIKKEILPKAV